MFTRDPNPHPRPLPTPSPAISTRESPPTTFRHTQRKRLFSFKSRKWRVFATNVLDYFFASS